MTVTEKTILTLLKKGYSQKEIAEHFKQDDSLRISGLSSIEKTIKSLKKQNNEKKPTQSRYLRLRRHHLSR